MFKRMLCLCIAVILLLSGCAQTDETSDASQSTTTTSSAPAAVSSRHTSTTWNTDMSETTPSDDTSTSYSTSVSAQSASTSATTQSHGAQVTTSVHKISVTAASLTSAASAATSAATSGSNVTFTATIRNDKQKPVGGVTVSVWVSDDECLGSAVTDDSGKARIPVSPTIKSYRVRLSNLPAGYEADSEYRFSTTTVNITIRKSAVQNENDHSQAQYEVGNKMTDFTLTDTEGNTYRLSELLNDKQLIILDFWYTTCEPCKSEFPYFEAAVQKYGDKMKLLAVNPINDNNAIVKLRNQLNAHPETAISFPMLRDTCKLYLGFDVMAYPTTIFINADGIILDIHEGAYPSESAFLTAIERYLQ